METAVAGVQAAEGTEGVTVAVAKGAAAEGAATEEVEMPGAKVVVEEEEVMAAAETPTSTCSSRR